MRVLGCIVLALLPYEYGTSTSSITTVIQQWILPNLVDCEVQALLHGPTHADTCHKQPIIYLPEITSLSLFLGYCKIKFIPMQ